MTATSIRYILSGIKAEIRREKDRERRVHLAIMGLFWNRMLITDCGIVDNYFWPDDLISTVDQLYLNY